MATKRKSPAKKKTQPKKEEIIAPVEEKIEEKVTEQVIEPLPEEKPVEEKPKTVKEKPKKEEKGPKYKVGSIVFISKEAEADLNGFKLFPQYKKYTYTVEAYDQISGVYTLRRLNLSLRLKEGLILAPSERAHDVLNRRQF